MKALPFLFIASILTLCTARPAPAVMTEYSTTNRIVVMTNVLPATEVHPLAAYVIFPAPSTGTVSISRVTRGVIVPLARHGFTNVAALTWLAPADYPLRRGEALAVSSTVARFTLQLESSNDGSDIQRTDTPEWFDDGNPSVLQSASGVGSTQVIVTNTAQLFVTNSTQLIVTNTTQVVVSNAPTIVVTNIVNVQGGGSVSPLQGDIDAAGWSVTNARLLAASNLTLRITWTANAAGTNQLVVSGAGVAEANGTYYWSGDGGFPNSCGFNGGVDRGYVMTNAGHIMEIYFESGSGIWRLDESCVQAYYSTTGSAPTDTWTGDSPVPASAYAADDITTNTGTLVVAPLNGIGVTNQFLTAHGDGNVSWRGNFNAIDAATLGGFPAAAFANVFTGQTESLDVIVPDGTGGFATNTLHFENGIYTGHTVPVP